MRNVSIMPVSLAQAIALPDAMLVETQLANARRDFSNKIVVLDDDPTGVQTVHDIPVYTHWDTETLAEGLCAESGMFFILTNSRGLTTSQTELVHREIAKNLVEASQKTQVPFLLLSRCDSTLRGHYPLETEVLRQTIEAYSAIRYDGEILMPYFQEGGRLTIDNVHYVKTGDQLVPAGLTEFSKDTTFAFSSSDLRDWCEEKTEGRFPADLVTTISLEELRGLQYQQMLEKLLTVQDFGKVVVNAADDRDVQVFVTVLLRAIAAGKRYLFRCAAGLVRILGNVDHQPLLSRSVLCPLETGTGGLVIVGSHVKKTTEQLEQLLSIPTGLHPICFDVERILIPGGLEQERDRVLLETENAIRNGETAVVYTSRKVLRVDQESTLENLNLSVRISQALTSVVKMLTIRPSFLIAKGGITSSDVGIRALGVRRAWVLGQAAPGIPVWRTGPESKFPGLSYVIFPGNVGDTNTLRDIVLKLMRK